MECDIEEQVASSILLRVRRWERRMEKLNYL
jgi:hypothetical protein